MNACQSVKANGLNHDHEKGVAPGASPAKYCHSAATTKSARATYWMPSRMFWIRSPISTPRQLTQVIAAMKTTPVAVTSTTLSARRCVLGAAHDPVDERPEVDAGDLRQVREHDHAGHRHAPSAHPARPRPERLRPPRERRAAVRNVVVELPVGVGDEQHRDERDDERDRRLTAHGEDHEPEARHERIDGGRRGEPDDGGTPQSERAGRQALSVGTVEVDRCGGHNPDARTAGGAGQAGRADRHGRGEPTAGSTTRRGDAPPVHSQARGRPGTQNGGSVRSAASARNSAAHAASITRSHSPRTVVSSCH